MRKIGRTVELRVQVFDEEEKITRIVNYAGLMSRHYLYVKNMSRPEEIEKRTCFKIKKRETVHSEDSWLTEEPDRIRVLNVTNIGLCDPRLVEIEPDDDVIQQLQKYLRERI